MSKKNDSESPKNHLSEAAGEIAGETADAAKEATGRAADNARHLAAEVTVATRDAANRVTDKAKDIYHSAAVKTGETLTTSKEYVRRNPVPVVLGAVAFGAALGCMVMMARRKPTFGERYDDEPLAAVREAILGALAPVTHRVHQGYGSARDGAGRAMDRVHRFGREHRCSSISDQIGRISNNLKFW